MSPRTMAYLFTIFFFLFGATGAIAAPPAQTELTPQQWREDLKYLAEQLRQRHPNPFYKTPEREFQRAVDELDKAIPQLERSDIVADFIRLAAMLDGHTNIPFWQSGVDFHLYPLRLYEFSDGLFVIDAARAYSHVVGTRLVKIGAVNIEEAYPRVSRYAQRDNAGTVKLLTPLFLMMPEVLRAQHLIAEPNTPQLVFERADGERVTLNPQAVSANQYLAELPGTFYTGLVKRDAPLMQARKDEAFWSTYLTPTNTLYIQYNQVRLTAASKSLYQFTEELAHVLREKPVARVVVDVRHNGGGDNTTYSALLNFLRDTPAVNQRGKLFVITGRQTFSAAANFSTDLEQKTQALFAGEPMGGSPNLYGDTRTFTLPHSRIQVWISARTWIKSTRDDPRASIEPEIPVEIDSAAYFAKQDPVLDAVLEYAPRAAQAISPTVRAVTFTASYSATLYGTVYGNGRTAVIFSNMGANKQSDWETVARSVAARGYMALTYDNRYWVSDTKIQNDLRRFAPDDLRAAVRFARTQDAQRIVLVGASLGSMASAKVSAESNPAAVVLVASPIDRTELPFVVTGDDIRAIASPKLFLVAETDELGFTDDVVKMYDIAQSPKQLVQFEGSAHGTDVFKTSLGQSVGTTILEFLETHVALP